MIPLRDENPTTLRPIVTIFLIAANGVVFLYEISLLSENSQAFEAFLYEMGMVPASLRRGGIFSAGGPYTVITSMFLHGSWLHLIGNMLYLWIFGNNIEDSMGHSRFVIFYLLTGIGAATTPLYFNMNSTVPTIGASGAVSGVLGAYLILFPHARVLTLIPLGWFIRIMVLPAWVLLLVWIGFQILNQTLAPMDPTTGGVAYSAHIGGFVFGMALIPLFRKFRRRSHFRTH